MSKFQSKVVFDNGSGSIKAGIVSETDDYSQTPVVFRNVISKHQGTPEEDSTLFIGDEALNNRGKLDLIYPITDGVIEDWDAMEEIWRNIFYYKICQPPEEVDAMILNEPVNNSWANREKILTIFFEKFWVKKIILYPNPLLQLTALGRTTGLVVNCGEGAFTTTGVWEGVTLPETYKKMNVGGRDLTQYMKVLLQEHGVTVDFESAREIKDQFCTVSTNFKQEQSQKVNIYVMPDKQEVQVPQNLCLKCPEILFESCQEYDETFDCNQISIQKLIQKSILSSNIFSRTELYRNILLTGEGRMPGLAERLKNELDELAPKKEMIRLPVCKEANLTYIGGCTLASLSNTESEYITAEEYAENGVQKIVRKLGRRC